MEMGRHETFKRFAGVIAVFMLATGITAVSALASADHAGNLPRSGALHATKECSQYNGEAGAFCTITSSSLKAIDRGSRVTYAQPAGATGLESDLVLYTGPGNHAFGHVTLSFASLSGVVTFSGGTGQFRGFHGHVTVTFSPATNLWYWDGTYSFDPPAH
jgi:hypothetical protein